MPHLTAEALFFRALRVPAASRDDWIARACAHDPARGSDLSTLLRAHAAARRLPDVTPPGLPRLEPGTRVARYTLRRRVGEGGCGIVFSARSGEPEEPLLALKLIKPGFVSPEAVARFDQEGRALARLSHRGVPRLIDRGRTEAGEAYLAMELVRGRQLTVHCDARRLTVAERLKLLARFCDVLGHVHDRGVRHGDVKPANILVTGAAGENRAGTPVLVDFGLASLKPEPGSATGVPAGDVAAGTLRYLSPEQVNPTAAGVDHRSDLYAAGVVLHELLTGRTPFSGGRLDELRHWFATAGAVTPSRVLAARTAGERRRLARQRGTSVAGLTRALRGAVDALARQALARDPARRFQSAAEFAAAIRRVLRTAPGPRPASAARAFPERRVVHSATPATFPAHSALPRRETPARAA